MISIVIPIYNTSIYLEDCLLSVLNQTYKDLEIILVDDGSTDNSLEICHSFSKIDKRIKVFHKENSGVSATRNYGITKATGEFLSFCDSDDILSLSLYETLYTKMLEYNVDRITAGYQYLYPSGRTVKCIERRPDGRYETNELISEMIDDGSLSGFLFSGVNNTLFRKSIIDKYNIIFNENIRYNEDSLFSLEYAIRSRSLYSIQSMPFYSYRQHATSATSKKKEGDIYKPLKEYILTNLNHIDNLNLEVQLKRRNVTETLWEVLEISRFGKGVTAIKDIHNVIMQRNIKNDVKYLQPDKMNKYKRIYLFLLKHKMATTLFVLSKYLLPIASKYLSR